MTPRPRTGVLSRYWDLTTRRQQLFKRIHECGPLIVGQVILQASAGSPGALDQILEAFSQLKPKDYSAASADTLPIDQLKVVNGGRRQ
jgi:hypothetical protein